MRLKEPRIAPLAEGEGDERQKEILSMRGRGGPTLNIFRTMVKSPDAAEAFLTWGRYILSKKSSLRAREREILILRTGFLCKSGYEFTQHTRIGLESGLTNKEIGRIKGGAEAGWNEADAALIRFADDLHNDFFVSNAVWAEALKHFSERQCMDAVYTCGQYTQVSMLLNSFGVPLAEGQVLDPELADYK
ncbi:MAG: carboxymuconolactone decarboxylase family protein [Alphaproteobacteria bacterium]